MNKEKRSGWIRMLIGGALGLLGGFVWVPYVLYSREYPPLALLAACAAGTTRITGAARLRYKESDRLASIAAALRALGADVRDLPDGLEIAGGRLTGGTVDACGDHRIAMLAAIASARCDVRLRGAECVEKSDPHFWQTLAGLRSGTEESR